MKPIDILIILAIIYNVLVIPELRQAAIEKERIFIQKNLRKYGYYYFQKDIRYKVNWKYYLERIKK